MSDGDNMDHERAMEEVTDRILLEISVMKHDKAFAKKLMEKLAEDIDGL